jgi:hypothetical protein
VYQRWHYTHGTEAPLAALPPRQLHYAPDAAAADIAEAAAQLRRAFRALGVSAPPQPMENTPAAAAAVAAEGRRSVRPPPPSMAEASAAAFNRRHPQLAEALAGALSAIAGVDGVLGPSRLPALLETAAATGHLRASPGAPAPPAGSRGVRPDEARGTEQVADDADTLEPLVGVAPATEALRELRRAWVRLAGGSRDDPAGALAPLSVSATVRVEGWRGMLQRIRAAIDAEVAPMVGSVLLRHAL